MTGLGKPEPLKHNLSGLWSRRFSRHDRLIYRFDDARIYIHAIGGHYDQEKISQTTRSALPHK